MSQIEKKKKLYETVVEHIVFLVNTKQLKVGSKVPSERDLAEELKVARPTVREAFRILENFGYIEAGKGGRMYISSLSLDSLVAPISEIFTKNDNFLEEILEMRLILETEIIKIATIRRSDEDIEELTKILKQMEEDINNGGTGCKDDYLFHLKIAQITGNSCISSVFQMCRGLLTKVLDAAFDNNPGMPMIVYKEHQEIVSAIKLGDADRAARILHTHLYMANERAHGNIGLLENIKHFKGS